jgi:hypothetical protein
MPTWTPEVAAMPRLIHPERIRLRLKVGSTPIARWMRQPLMPTPCAA